jgi:hypothetical protein
MAKETLGNAVLSRINCGNMSEMRSSIGLQGFNQSVTADFDVNLPCYSP